MAECRSMSTLQLLIVAAFAISTAARSHKSGHVGCAHDEIVEPYHQELLANLSAVNMSAHVSLNVRTDLTWLPGQTEMAEKEAKIQFSKVSASSASLPEAIRITVDYQIDQSTPQSAVWHLKKRLVPHMISTLQRYIKVKDPVKGTFKLPRQCSLQGPDGICIAAAPIANCGSLASHNPDYFGDFVECQRDGRCQYIRGGQGLKDTDFLLYITAETTSHCSRGLLAFAGYCILDPLSNRPLAGFANFCPDALTTDKESFQAQLETAVHETLHVLAFSMSLFSKFIAPDGQLMRHEDVLQSFQEHGRRVRKIVTPTVVHEARKHFNCSTLNGAEVENEGGPGIAGSHWESRFFQYEIMDGQAGNDMDFERHVVSRMTLALLQDSGWYVPNWEAAGTLLLGQHAGCSFIEADCREPVETQKGYYCTVREDQCTWDRTAQGTCDEDYFLMDGCSYTRPYINTVCTNSSHLQNSALSWGQGYGMQSRCLEHDTSEVFVRRSQGYVEPPPLGCYEMACSYEGDRLFLKLFDQYIECHEGDHLHLGSIPGQDFISGSIGPCPSPESICPGLRCPSGCTSNGRCIGGVCECYLGFSGADCSLESCTLSSCKFPQVCSPHTGLCSIVGTDDYLSTSRNSQKRMEGSAEKAFGAWVQLTDGKWVEVVDPRAKSEITPGNEVLNTDYGFASSSPRHVAAPYIETNARSSFELTMMIAIIIGVICAVLSIVLLILLRARTKNRSQEQSHKTDPDAQHCKAMHDSESAIALTEICNGVSQRSYAPSVKQTESAAMVGKGCNAALHKSNVFVGSEPTTPEIYTLPGPPVGCLEIGPMQLKCHLNSPGAILTDQPRSITGSGDLPESPCLAAYCGRSDTPRSRT